MVGSALQYTRAASEEETVEVVENHAGGTWRSPGRLFPKVVAREGVSPGVDSGVGSTTKGRSLENPKRGSSVG